ncbi:recombinase family protein [Bradyrhizobium pachyrhizi]|uniref:recombinase family protein n=1 Tax=Bradyrhizobium pachyrhizi TaxID=280333 RepID=UPI0024B08370|nr:recombinase family protein [Bradyrhizobium pachyrhizi]WFU59981.1 recombinase family protein [Bradyrhizobium pachyrhizi]
MQLAQLEAAVCERILCEREGGMNDHRRELTRLLRRLRKGDTVIVPALDRLTRGGPFKMLSVLADITSRGATYRSLAEPWADITHELGEVLAALVGYSARKTREDIIRRTSEGRKRAREKGIKFGRKPKLTLDERRVARELCATGKSQRDVAIAFGVSSSTISRICATDNIDQGTKPTNETAPFSV